jgi:glycosyltransferase involved in cell wall biosynthesis
MTCCGASLQGVTLVLGTSAGGTGAHVRMLAAGLTRQGILVSVAGPAACDATFSFSAAGSVAFSAVEISGRPRAGDVAEILRLRELLLRPAGSDRGGPGGDRGGPGGDRGGPGGDGPGQPDGGDPPGAGRVVHAHGLRAGALVVLALLLTRGRPRPGVVVTVHNAPPRGRAAAGVIYRLLEFLVARGADLVLCVSPDLEARMRAAGARSVRRAVIAAADPSPGSPAPVPVPEPGPRGRPAPAAAAQGPGAPGSQEARAGRPVVFTAGRLTAQKGLDVLLEAAACWRDLEPMPLVVIAGDGPLARKLRARAAALAAPVVFLGHRDDVAARLAAAAVFVLPSQWEGQPLALQEALRAGVPVVATRVGGVALLTGEDAALLVPAGDVRALADAVRSVLTDPGLAARLAAAARARAGALPTERDAVAAALAAYRAVIG